MRRFQPCLNSDSSGVPVESGDRASGVSAKVKPFNRFFRLAESALGRRMT